MGHRWSGWLDLGLHSAEGSGRKAGWIQDCKCPDIRGWALAEYLFSCGSQGDQGVVNAPRARELDSYGKATVRESGR